MKPGRPVRVAALLAPILFVAAREAVAQCAMCKEALEADPASTAGLTRGLFWTILLFLGTFFSLAGAVVWKIVQAGRS
jgi:hypothetical protein